MSRAHARARRASASARALVFGSGLLLACSGSSAGPVSSASSGSAASASAGARASANARLATGDATACRALLETVASGNRALAAKMPKTDDLAEVANAERAIAADMEALARGVDAHPLGPPELAARAGAIAKSLRAAADALRANVDAVEKSDEQAAASASERQTKALGELDANIAVLEALCH